MLGVEGKWDAQPPPDLPGLCQYRKITIINLGLKFAQLPFRRAYFRGAIIYPGLRMDGGGLFSGRDYIYPELRVEWGGGAYFLGGIIYPGLIEGAYFSD